MNYTDACICQDSAESVLTICAFHFTSKKKKKGKVELVGSESRPPPASVQPEPEVLRASCPLTGAPLTTPVLSDGEPDKCMGAQGTEPETEPKVPEGVISDPQEGVSSPLISR